MKFMISNFKKLNDAELVGINGGAGACSGFYSNYCESPKTIGNASGSSGFYSNYCESPKTVGYASGCSGSNFVPVNNEVPKPLIYVLTTNGRTRF